MNRINTFLTLILCCIMVQMTSAQEGRYLQEVFTDVTVTQNGVYGANATVLALQSAGEAIPQPLIYDLYEPTGDTSAARPLVIYLHTGNFLPIGINGTTAGSLRDSTAVEICTRLAKMGYVAASVDYRQGWNPFAETQPLRALGLIQASYRGIQDARTATRFFRMNKDAFKIDDTRITVFGQGTGGYISLGVGVVDDFTKILTTEMPAGKFITDLDGDGVAAEPMVIPTINGDVNGLGVGIAPAGLGFPEGDTLNYPNWEGVSSDVHLIVNLGGAMGDLSWLDANSKPIISFQSPTDPFAPYESDVLIVPTTNERIVEVQGAKLIMEKANQADVNVNAAFAGVTYDDPYTARAIEASAQAGHDYYEGLFPLILPTNQLGNEEGSPWDWWDAAIWGAQEHPSCPEGSFPACNFHTIGLLNNFNMSAESARMYIDTVIGYFAPRAYLALDLESSGTVSSIEEISYINSIDVMPNPAQTQAVVSFDNPEFQRHQIQLLDITGKVVRTYSVNNQNNLRIERGELASGLYFGRITNDKGQQAAFKLVFR